MLDELKRILVVSPNWDKPSLAGDFLSRHGPALIAAVEHIEADIGLDRLWSAENEEGDCPPNPTDIQREKEDELFRARNAATAAYRAAKEAQCP